MGLFENLSGAKGLRQQGEAAQAFAEAQAKIAEQKAKGAIIKSKFKQKRQAEAAERRRSAQRADIAKRGGAGSPVAEDLAVEQLAEFELENLLIGFEGQVEAAQFRNQAALDRFRGRIRKAGAKSAARAANIQFGTQLAVLGAGLGSTDTTGTETGITGAGDPFKTTRIRF